MLTIDQLQIGDVLKRIDGGAYVVRRFWFGPNTKRNITYFPRVGVTLLDTVSVTDREVTAEDLNLALDAQTLTAYDVPTVRHAPTLHAKRVPNSPLKQHKPNGK